jgi:cell division protein YceG involved in septum cleavage
VSSSKKVLIGIVALLVAGVALVGIGWLWVENQLAGDPIVAGEPVTYEVRSGATATSIGQDLADLDVVRNAFLFRLVARSRGLDARLAAGAYELETGHEHR